MPDLPPLTFASIRREKEYGQLTEKNPQLKRVIDGAAEHAFAEWGWILCLTDIFRSRQEAALIDAASAAPGGLGMGRPAGSTSPHCVWQAADVRIRSVNPSQVSALVEWVNATWVYRPGDPSRRVALANPHGTGPHIHLQVTAATRLRA